MRGLNRVMAIVLGIVLISAGNSWAQKVKPWKNITAKVGLQGLGGGSAHWLDFAADGWGQAGESLPQMVRHAEAVVAANPRYRDIDCHDLVAALVYTAEVTAPRLLQGGLARK